MFDMLPLNLGSPLGVTQLQQIVFSCKSRHYGFATPIKSTTFKQTKSALTLSTCNPAAEQGYTRTAESQSKGKRRFLFSVCRGVCSEF